MIFKYFVFFFLVITVNAFDKLNKFPDDFEDLIDISVLGSEVFGSPDLMSGEKLAKWKPMINGSNAEEQGTYFEGDILFEMPTGRHGTSDTTKRWPNGIVYYVIEGSCSTSELSVIASAMNTISSKTSITFVLRTSQTDYVAITSINAGCYSAIGKVGGKQIINLQSPGCFVKVGTVIHQLLHTLGFFHEHTRSDRDSYITVQYANIITGLSYKFDKLNIGVGLTYGISYDYKSVMHYSEFAYSSNGQKTIVAIGAGISITNIGQRDALSENDIIMINMMYSGGSGGSSGGIDTNALAAIIAMRTCVVNRIQLFLSSNNIVSETPTGFETND